MSLVSARMRPNNSGLSFAIGAPMGRQAQRLVDAAMAVRRSHAAYPTKVRASPTHSRGDVQRQ